MGARGTLYAPGTPLHGARAERLERSTEGREDGRARLLSDPPFAPPASILGIVRTGGAVLFFVDPDTRPVVLDYCPTCGRPAHASETADDGVCAKCAGRSPWDTE